MIISKQSVRGKVREENQDSMEVFRNGDFLFFIVADGMGGHNGGKFAGEHCVEKVKEFLTNNKLKQSKITNTMKNAVQYANTCLYRIAEERKEYRGMGTTLVLACIYKNALYVENVGDSRAYLYRKQDIRQITLDHSYVEELVRMGEITEREAKHHPERNKITRAVGTEETVESDSFKESLENKDIVIVCTDGLTKMLSDKRILYEIAGTNDYSDLAERLCDSANREGGTDNISVITVRVEENAL